MEILITGLALLLILVLVYQLGPRPVRPVYDMKFPDLPDDLYELDKQIRDTELKTPYLRKDNEARIVWVPGKEYEQTEYSLVFLHGFSASYKEIDPIHKDFGERYGCNVYLSRLHEHGVDSPEPMLDFTAEKFMASGLSAVAIGKKIGKKVIVISASTGSTIGIYIAAHHPEIHALICYSPNVDLYSSLSNLLPGPWGLYIARLFHWSKYRERYIEPEGQPYWIRKHRLEALVSLKTIVRSTMKKNIFRKVNQPFFLAYYFRNKHFQDKTVSVWKMLKMFENLGTPEDQKRKMSFPRAGVHAIGSPFTSGAAFRLKIETYRFAEEILKLTPVYPADPLSKVIDSPKTEYK